MKEAARRLSNLLKPQTISLSTLPPKSSVSHDGIPRVLILGAGQSGKSTLLKAMKLFCGDTYSLAERHAFKYIVFDNVVQSMRAILNYMETMEIPLNDSRLQVEFELSQLVAMDINEQSSRLEAFEAIGYLWRDSQVQLTFRESAEYELDSSCA